MLRAIRRIEVTKH